MNESSNSSGQSSTKCENHHVCPTCDDASPTSTTLPTDACSSEPVKQSEELIMTDCENMERVVEVGFSFEGGLLSRCTAEEPSSSFEFFLLEKKNKLLGFKTLTARCTIGKEPDSENRVAYVAPSIRDIDAKLMFLLADFAGNLSPNQLCLFSKIIKSIQH